MSQKDIEAPLSDDGALPPKGESLLLGFYPIAPERFLHLILVGFTAFFLLYRIADVVYIFTIDGHFPEALEGTYASNAEQLRVVSYMRSVMVASVCSHCVTFCAVVALVCTAAPAAVDDHLSKSGARLGSCPSVFRVLGRCWGGCLSWSWDSLSARCCCGFAPKWQTLFRGAVFLSMSAAFFKLIQVPFDIWTFNIDVEYGFVNILTVSPGIYKRNLLAGVLEGLFTSIPTYILYLTVLQWRFGWLLMWVGLIAASTLAQYNMGQLAPQMLGASGPFPSADFAVGRNFPLAAKEDDPDRPVSLNRIFYGNKTAGTFKTNDFSVGAVKLVAQGGAGHVPSRWVLKDDGANEALAATQGKVPYGKDNAERLRGLSKQSWTVHGQPADSAQIGVRHGKQLREKLFGFAKDHGIPISEVYMIEGSSQDARANAFAAGAGSGRVIGLYDTLFLGGHTPQGKSSSGAAPEEWDFSSKVRSLLLHSRGIPAEAEGQDSNPQEGDGDVSRSVSIQRLSELLRGVHVLEGTALSVWQSAPSRAMTDDEILAVMGHELGHSAMHHVETGMVQQAATSFMTFALLGWMVHSPLVAAAFSLAAPVSHVAVFAYDHVLGNLWDGITKIVTDGMTRRNEYQADAYSARVSLKYANGLQTALAKLTVNCNDDPTMPYFYEVLHTDHPSFTRRWQAVEAVKKQQMYPGYK